MTEPPTSNAALKGGVDVTFGYRCDECAEGIVRAKRIREYDTLINGNPFTVKEAIIGVCANCGAEYFSAAEVERWEREFENEMYLQPDEIKAIRESLGLTKEALAQLIGCTRQSIYAWERTDRERAQSRMADLLLKLVALGAEERNVDVLSFLKREAVSLGKEIELTTPRHVKPVILNAKKRHRASDSSPGSRLAASSKEDSEPYVALLDDRGEEVGVLKYDYGAGTLDFYVKDPVDMTRADIQVRLRNGELKEAKGVYLARRTTLLKDTECTEEDVSEVSLSPSEASLDESRGVEG